MNRAMSPILILLFICCWERPFYADAYTKTELYSLISYLFTGYNLEARPTSQGEATDVYVDVYLLSVESLDERAQELETSLVIESWWNDDYLLWNEADFGGITQILYHQEKVWLPDVVVENSVTRRRQMGYEENKVIIQSSGNIFWKPSEIVKTDCDIDVKYYPFDTQICKIIISTWMSTKDEVRIVPDYNTKGMLLDSYSVSGTWDLVGNTFTELGDSNGLTRIQFTLTLRRRKTYYVLNLILPLVFLSFTASIVFILPAESGEKVGLSITVLLAYAVYLTVVSADMPQTSLQVSMLEVYLTSLLGLTAVGVIFTVIVLHLHHKSQGAVVGPYTKTVTLIIRRFLWLQRDASGEDKSFRGEKFRPRNPLVRSGAVTPIEDEEQPPPTVYHGEGSYAEEEEITWVQVSEALDRVCFIVFTAFVCLFTVIFLVVMATGD